jgi:hypothetical protein
MGRKFTAFVISVLLVACTSTAEMPHVALDPKKIVILAPQGVDPGKDTVGFNPLVKNLTQAFSAAFIGELSGLELQTVNVLDQRPTPKLGEKFALYSLTHSAGKVAIATLETKSVGNDTQLLLRIQFIEGELVSSSQTAQAVRARTTLEKSYFLRGSQSGDTSLSMSDIARDFVDYIRKAGRLAI